MSESVQLVLRKFIAISCAAMLVATLSAIAVVRADQRTEVAASGGSGGGDEGTFEGVDGGGVEGGVDGVLGPDGAVGGAGTGGTGGGGGSGGEGGAAGGGGATGGGRTRGGASGPYPNTGTNCPDYNPRIGVFCHKFLVGGTTVLSGPLAVYGDQGIKGGLAWIAYYNNQIAPKERIRKVELKWYDDNLDPNKTLLYVQRLNEVDKVLYIAGVTSPEAVASYLESAKLPMIGDIGLSPKSWTNRYIFPTTPSEQERNVIRIKAAKQFVGISSFSVIQDILPGVDPSPIKKSWENSADKNGVKIVDYVEISSTASDCSGQMSRVINTAQKPDYLILPTATPVLLACMREAQRAAVKPKSNTSPWLKGWSGGSNLQLEVDNCKPWCEGMFSIGTVFHDPRVANTPQIRAYRENMARYAPNVDLTGFIAINYYHAGYVFYSMLKDKGILHNLSRDTIMTAAESFGPFDTGFGNSIQWTKKIPRVPWTCGYPVQVQGDRWVFFSEKVCM